MRRAEAVAQLAAVLEFHDGGREPIDDLGEFLREELDLETDDLEATVVGDLEASGLRWGPASRSPPRSPTSPLVKIVAGGLGGDRREPLEARQPLRHDHREAHGEETAVRAGTLELARYPLRERDAGGDRELARSISAQSTVLSLTDLFATESGTTVTAKLLPAPIFASQKVGPPRVELRSYGPHPQRIPLPHGPCLQAKKR